MTLFLSIILGITGILASRDMKRAKSGRRLIWVILMMGIVALIGWQQKDIPLRNVLLILDAIIFVIYLVAYFYSRGFIRCLTVMPSEDRRSTVEKFPPQIKALLSEELNELKS
jgi:Ca2+/Na+ antiporter